MHAHWGMKTLGDPHFGRAKQFFAGLFRGHDPTPLSHGPGQAGPGQAGSGRAGSGDVQNLTRRVEVGFK